MKKILFMAATPEGLIAKTDGGVDWSEDDWRNYAEACASAENLIIGRSTYEIMLRDNEFKNLRLKRILVIGSEERENKDQYYFFTSPAAAIQFLEDQQAATVIIGGGSKLNSSMLSAQLIDEIQIDVEPKLFGKGYHLFAEQDSSYDLILLDTFKSGENTVRLHYQVEY